MKATEHGPASPAAGAFQAMARPLCAGGAGRRSRGTGGAESSERRPAPPSLAELTEGPYFVIVLMLDCDSLCMLDATSRLLSLLNNANAQVGPWRSLGTRRFQSLELENDGIFEQPVVGLELQTKDARSRKLARIDWKGRYRRFRAEVATFAAPFGGSTIAGIEKPDEVAYLRSRLCPDGQQPHSSQGVYLEVDVQQNPDNLSLAVVDFEAGGSSSITFSPDTGAVIRERKVREAPRKVEGAYIQSLASVPPGQRFRGRIGLYLYRGRLAFFRRCATDVLNPITIQEDAGAAGGISGSRNSLAREGADDRGLGPWESTGFISDVSWAEGRLTPCLAFRDEGAYHVHIANVGTSPPHPSRDWSTEDDATIGWSGFDWEVGPLDVAEWEDAPEGGAD